MSGGRATEYVVHGLRNFLDYDRPPGNQRQLLVTDQQANIISNFLAVFLALAGKSIFNILTRILSVYLQHRVNKSHSSDDVSSSRSANQNADPSATPSADQSTNQIAGQSADHSATQSNSQQGDEHADPNPGVEAGSDEASIIAPAPTIIRSRTNAVQSSPSPSNPSALQLFEMQEPRDYLIDRRDAANEYYDNEGTIWDSLRRIHVYLKNTRPMLPIERKTLYKPRIFAQYCSDWYEIAKRSPEDILWYSSVGTAAVVLYFGVIVLGIVSPYPVIDGSVALSEHPLCSIVTSGHPWNDTAPQQAMGAKFFTDIARESRQYAELCYGTQSDRSDKTDYCTFFYVPTIEYSTKDNDVCPFSVGDDPLCLDGEQGAYTVMTSNTRTTKGFPSDVFMDAQDIGINSPLQYKVHRKLSCAPLKTEGFVRPVAKDDGSLFFRYFYGNRTGGTNCTEDLPNCTYEISVDPNYDGPYQVYSDSTRSLIPWTWYPIFDVNSTLGETATLALISNYGIGYPGESLDPIFRGNTTWGDGRYYNTQWHASVLGCMSATLVCYPDHLSWQCYSLKTFGDLGYEDPEHGPVRSMLYFSLLSDLEEQLGYLRAEAFHAQSLLSGSLSSELSKTQWKDEIQQLFEQMLARMQINARNIARGVPGTPLPDQRDVMKPEWRKLCTQYKFRAIGWKNISLGWLLGEFFAGLVLLILGIRRDNEETEEGPVEQPAKQETELYVERPVRWVLKSSFGQGCGFVTSYVWTGCCWPFSRMWKWLCGIAEWRFHRRGDR